MWGTSDNTRTAYMDTQDIARMTLAAIRKDETIGKTLTLAVREGFALPTLGSLRSPSPKAAKASQLG